MSIVNISSENKKNSYDTDAEFSVNLKKTIQRCVGMQLLNVTVPLSYNVVSTEDRSILLIFFIKRRDLFKFQIKFKYFIFMLFEGCLLGVLLLFLLNDISLFSFKNLVYQDNLLLNLYLCIGAGIWEETLFRFFLFSIIYKLFSSSKNNDAFLSFYISVFLSSLLFSMFQKKYPEMYLEFHFLLFICSFYNVFLQII